MAMTELTRLDTADARRTRRAVEVLAQMYAYFSYDALPAPAASLDAPEYALVA